MTSEQTASEMLCGLCDSAMKIADFVDREHVQMSASRLAILDAVAVAIKRIREHEMIDEVAQPPKRKRLRRDHPLWHFSDGSKTSTTPLRGSTRTFMINIGYNVDDDEDTRRAVLDYGVKTRGYRRVMASLRGKQTSSTARLSDLARDHLTDDIIYVTFKYGKDSK